jgi:hypothetical protein
LNQDCVFATTDGCESDVVARVSEIANPLPSDIAALQALLAAARAERDAALSERDNALSQIDRLRHLLRQLQRAQFGPGSEKLDGDQLRLALEDIEQRLPAARPRPTKETRSPRRRAASSGERTVVGFLLICRVLM